MTPEMTPDITSADMDRDAIRAEFQRERGYWRGWNETLLRERPGFLRRYARYAGYPARTGPLTARQVELIYVALDASSSHLFESGLRTHMAKALEAGASAAEVFDVLHLVAAQGLECVTQAAAILAAETAPAPGTAALSPEPRPPAPTAGLRWLAEIDPGYAQAMQEFLADDPGAHGLPPSDRCLVQVALHACFTAFNPEALRQHIRQGVALGLSTREMLQAIELGAHLSVHGTALGAQVFESLK